MGTLAIPLLGLGAYAAYRLRKEGKQIHLPGHNYVGPGTDLSKHNLAVDKDDQIAEEHDRHYQSIEQQALSYGVDREELFKAISAADSVAIQKAESDYRKTGNIHSVLVASGLIAKNSVESALGRNIYPGNIQQRVGKYASSIST